MNTVSILVTVVIINWNFRGPRTHRMPMWIRSVFLHYLPAFLFMKRPRKTRLRWMMEMPGMSMPAHPHPSYGSPAELPKHISAIGGKQSKMEVMELSDLHHPNCKINRKVNSGAELGLGDGCRRESESSDSILLSPEASKATEAVEFIAEHLRNEDLYIQVSGRGERRVIYSTNLFPSADSRGLEVRGHGHRSLAAVHFLHCNHSWHCWHFNGCATYL